MTEPFEDRIKVVVCDVSNVDGILNTRKDIVSQIGKIELIAYSIAFTPGDKVKERFLDTPQKKV